jgi:hypothetical protein
MGLIRLGISNPAATTATTIFTSDNQYLTSIIAANKSLTTSANVRVWVQPSGSSTESQYAYISYDLVIPPSNSLETFRFAVNQNDVVKVYSSTANVSFSAYGLVQYDIKFGAGISSYSSTAPSNPVDGMIWVNSAGSIAGSSAKPTYVYSATEAAWIAMATLQSEKYASYGTTQPASPVIGDIFVDNTIPTAPILKVYSGSAWISMTALGLSIGNTQPSSPTTGNIWVDTTIAISPTLKVYNGSTWITPATAVNDRDLVLAQRMFN